MGNGSWAKSRILLYIDVFIQRSNDCFEIERIILVATDSIGLVIVAKYSSVGIKGDPTRNMKFPT